MGIVARYIDALSDVQRDRVIEAKEWTWDFVDAKDPSCRCLVGHAEDYNDLSLPVDRTDNGLRYAHNSRGDSVAMAVPYMFERFGKNRIIRACKARAAKGNRLHEIREEIYRGLTVPEVLRWREKAAGLVPVGGMSGRFPEDLR